MDACTHWPPERIAAGVVLYHPREAALRLVDALVDQFDRVFVVENESAVFRGADDEQGVHVERNFENAGLARAINQLCDSARAARFDWLVLFDQDSGVPAGFRDRFAQIFSILPEPPALLAANYVTELCGEAFPGYRLDGDAAIGERVVDLNAGSLINLPIHQQVGGHSESLFVDHVDHEYCLRLRRHGYSVLATRESLFNHEIGNIVSERRFGRVWQSGGHSPARRGEAIEALMRVIKTYWRYEPAWCARMLCIELPRSVVAMLILERQRVAKITALIVGIARGAFRSKLSVS